MSSPKAKWIRRLERLNATLLHVEALSEALSEFGVSAHEWRAGQLSAAVTQMWAHWSAVVLRSVCRKGPQRHHGRNVSIEGLLESMSGDAEALLRVARIDELRRWLHRRPSEEAIRNRLERDKKKILSSSERVKRFGDTIAHVQLRARRMKGRRLRLCMETARKTVDRYYRLLTSRALPTEERRKFVDRILDDIDRLRDKIEVAS